MPLDRTTVPTVAVSASVAALIAGVVVSSVEAGGHKSHKPARPAAAAVAQQRSVAQQLNAMKLPKGFEHSPLCPQPATPVDACVTAGLAKPAATAMEAVTDAAGMLTALGVKLAPERSCTSVPGGLEGSGYDCNALGTWNGTPLSTLVFISDSRHRPAGVPGLDAILSVQLPKA